MICFDKRLKLVCKALKAIDCQSNDFKDQSVKDIPSYARFKQQHVDQCQFERRRVATMMPDLPAQGLYE